MLLALAGGGLMLAAGMHSIRAAVFDYSAPYQNISAQPSGSSVLLRVVDGQGITRSTSVPSGPSFDMQTVHGVATWSSGATIYYYTYDPSKTNWVGQADTAGQTFDLLIGQGIVAWSSGTTVHYRAYDWLRSGWRSGSVASGTASGLAVADGVVSWSSPNGVYFRVYDVIQGSWVAANGPGPSAEVFNVNGVVAWSAGGAVHYYAYDPSRAGWRNGSQTGATFDLRTTNGVVSWSVTPNVYLRVYDPIRGQWIGSSVNSGYTTDLTLLGSTVSWSTTSAFYTRGYSPASGLWTSGAAEPQAIFAVSATAGNAPLLLAFVDMSLGGGSGSWNFGDGLGTSTQRSPFYRYTRFGRFTATLNVAGSVASRVILTDTLPPVGTNWINGGAALATNPAVTLTLQATDNSGVVSELRLSNDRTNWITWEPYATNRAWTLAPGDGLRTAYTQFRDAAGNTSATVSASIQLDSRAPPVARFLDTTVNENVGTATVQVRLDRASSQTVSVRYATSDGTATAGSDYSARAGLLVFVPGVTNVSFTVPILTDGQVELNESVILNFNSPTNLVPGPPGTLTITDDEFATVSLAATNLSALEGSGEALVSVQLSAGTGRTVSVGYGTSTNGSSATAGVDYLPVQGVLIFEPGQTLATFAVPLLDDALDEVSETVAIYLSGVTNALLMPPDSARLTILDDDNPVVNFSSATSDVFEHAGPAVVNVFLSKPFGQEVRVNYSVAGGTASAGSDYIAINGILFFFPGETNAEVLVNLINDASAEDDETVRVRLGNAAGASLGALTQTEVRVLDDDRPPRLIEPGFDGSRRFQATAWGPVGQRFHVQYSSNLGQWFPLLTLTNTTGRVLVTDPAPASGPPRFYRTVLP